MEPSEDEELPELQIGLPLLVVPVWVVPSGQPPGPAEDVGGDDDAIEEDGSDDAGVEEDGSDDAGVDDAGVDDAGVDDAGVDDVGGVDEVGGDDDVGGEDDVGGDDDSAEDVDDCVDDATDEGAEDEADEGAEDEAEDGAEDEAADDEERDDADDEDGSSSSSHSSPVSRTVPEHDPPPQNETEICSITQLSTQRGGDCRASPSHLAVYVLPDWHAMADDDEDDEETEDDDDETGSSSVQQEYRPNAIVQLFEQRKPEPIRSLQCASMCHAKGGLQSCCAKETCEAPSSTPKKISCITSDLNLIMAKPFNRR